jgi:hypothetical protein
VGAGDGAVASAVAVADADGLVASVGAVGVASAACAADASRATRVMMGPARMAGGASAGVARGKVRGGGMEDVRTWVGEALRAAGGG